jgi:hypothetical protein
MVVSDKTIAAMGIEEPATTWNSRRHTGGEAATVVRLSPPKTSMSKNQRINALPMSNIT